MANVTPAEAAEWQRRGRTTWLRSELRRIESEVFSEREACAKVVESFIDPEIESNTAYEDQVVDGMLWQVIAELRGAKPIGEASRLSDGLGNFLRRTIMEKCDDSGLCKHLRQRLVESGAGFYKIEQVQRQEVVTIAVLYKTNTKDRGLMLNICPWCEARIDHLNEEHRVKPRKAAA